ncbi:ATP-binding protein [Sphingomicrobium sp. XHP0239]|uniref:ATP-binding protein n=1 Tax=Sphingomicrobium maritimum TaxID=3133972 RepID=UPI0031CCAF81
MTVSTAADRVPPEFPRAAAITGIIAILVMTLGALASNLFVSDRTRAIVDVQYEVFEAAEELARAQLANDAALALAVASANPDDTARYDERVRELRDARRRLEEAIRLPENRIAFAEMDAVSRHLEAENRHVLDLVRSGDRGAAEARMRSTEIRSLRAETARVQEEIYARSRRHTSSLRDAVGNTLDLNLYAALAAMLLLVACGFLVARPARDWARELKRMEREAASLAEARSQFVAVMSHEIRTPLNGVIGFADMLLTDKTLNEEQRHRVEIIHSAGGMLLGIVNDVLDFSKLEAGQMLVAVEDFPLESLIDNCVSVVRPSSDAKNLAIETRIDANLPVFLRGDRGRLAQILMNLLGNAVKFTARGGVRIEVVQGAGTEVLFHVIDTGPGIAAETLERLFAPFTQADATVARDYGGTGLGLSISRQLARAMGGDIEVSSIEGTGTTFTLRLPLTPGTNPNAAGVVDHASAGARILLAEDVAMNQELAMAMLSSMGHCVEVVEDGAAALAAIRARDFDLVLMDIQMPHMDGLAAARAIRSMPGPRGKVPIIALTANGLPEQVIAYRKAGMDGHVAKPIHRPSLEAALSEHLGSVVSERPSAAHPQDAPLSFEETSFDGVRNLLGDERVAGHLETVANSLRDIDAASPSDQRAIAHKLASQAATLGLHRLARAAAAVEQDPNGRNLAELAAVSADVVVAQSRLEIIAPRQRA